MSKLSIEKLHLHYGALEVLKGVDLAFKEGDVVCLLGRSGSGKTTLLRAIAGLQHPTSGRISIDGKAVYDSATKLELPSEKRGLGMVFQSYALWPHKTVSENIAYGLRLRGVDAGERERRVKAALDGVELSDLGHRYPHQLSGGQQQRVALVRALVYEPPVILLDEPLSNLDAKPREEARIWIRDLIHRLGLTAVFVTHDQIEAMAICDKIVLLEQGKIVQVGTPEELYNEPASLFAAEFMGANNHANTRIVERSGKEARVEIAGRSFWGENRGGKDDGAEVAAVIRVDSVVMAEASDEENTIDAVVQTSLYLGGYYENVFRAGDVSIRARGQKLQPQATFRLKLPRQNLWIF